MVDLTEFCLSNFFFFLLISKRGFHYINHSPLFSSVCVYYIVSAGTWKKSGLVTKGIKSALELYLVRYMRYLKYLLPTTPCYGNIELCKCISRVESFCENPENGLPRVTHGITLKSFIVPCLFPTCSD